MRFKRDFARNAVNVGFSAVSGFKNCLGLYVLQRLILGCVEGLRLIDGVIVASVLRVRVVNRHYRVPG